MLPAFPISRLRIPQLLLGLVLAFFLTGCASFLGTEASKTVRITTNLPEHIFFITDKDGNDVANGWAGFAGTTPAASVFLGEDALAKAPYQVRLFDQNGEFAGEETITTQFRGLSPRAVLIPSGYTESEESALLKVEFRAPPGVFAIYDIEGNRVHFSVNDGKSIAQTEVELPVHSSSAPYAVVFVSALRNAAGNGDDEEFASCKYSLLPRPKIDGFTENSLGTVTGYSFDKLFVEWDGSEIIIEKGVVYVSGVAAFDYNRPSLSSSGYRVQSIDADGSLTLVSRAHDNSVRTDYSFSIGVSHPWANKFGLPLRCDSTPEIRRTRIKNASR
ncbi:MAG: hypothetical protein K0U36_05720 [Alphaproteobacteria bacterium]|nr:hypothetical protein [Alphaproteobacteria bacterium]